MPEFAFLIYQNRSGSTYLAARLDGLAGVAVTTESDFLAEFLEAEAGPAADIDRVLARLYAEPKFAAWGLDRDRVRAALSARAPLDAGGLCRAVLGLWAAGREADLVVLKGARLDRHLARLRREVPGARFIHIYRDPRAVYASQRRSRSSDGAGPMSRDPFEMAWNWCRSVERMAALAGPDILEVAYEDLITEPAATLDRLAEFLGTTATPESTDQGYAERIPAAQRHLHANVGKAPDTDRLDAWKTEIRPLDVRLIEELARPVMTNKGYAPAADLPVFPRAHLNRRALYLWIVRLVRRVLNALRAARTGRLGAKFRAWRAPR